MLADVAAATVVATCYTIFRDTPGWCEEGAAGSLKKSEDRRFACCDLQAIPPAALFLALPGRLVCL